MNRTLLERSYNTAICTCILKLVINSRYGQIWLCHSSEYGCINLQFCEDMPVIRTSRSRQHESCKLPTAELDGFGRISIFTVNTKEYHSDSSVVTLDDMEINPELTIQEEPVAILGRKSRQLRNKKIPLVKVEWKHQKGTRIRWEPKEKMRIRSKWGGKEYGEKLVDEVNIVVWTW
ncbi:hypothetical protein Tco_0550223 [Tanacetum coccineum]